MSKCRIAVLKKVVNQDIIDEYAAEDFKQSSCEGCDRFQVGQVFMVGWDEVPQGFCPWAWADIQRDVVSILMGGDAHWLQPKGTMITCCTDGFRPVVFKVERVE
jgi:uncharacterized repeat protein (TIGR04076 family)